MGDHLHCCGQGKLFKGRSSGYGILLSLSFLQEGRASLTERNDGFKFRAGDCFLHEGDTGNAIRVIWMS